MTLRCDDRKKEMRGKIMEVILIGFAEGEKKISK